MGRKKPAKIAQKQKGKEQHFENSATCKESTNLLTDFQKMQICTSSNSDAPLTGIREFQKYQAENKNIFHLYYAQREQEEKNLNLDFLKESIERDCYNGFTKDRIASFEHNVILLVNAERTKNGKEPVTFHVKKGEFDITVVEIQKQLHRIIFHDVDILEEHESKNMVHVARCLYDLMDEKYNQKPVSEKDVLDLEKVTEAKSVSIETIDEFTFDYLNTVGEGFERKVKLMKENNADEKKLKFAIKSKNAYQKCAKLMKQVEKLKEIRKESQNHVKLVEQGVADAIRTLLSLLDMEAMDELVDSFYLFLIIKRYDNGEKALSLHKIDGTFDLKIEEVQGAARFTKSQEDDQFSQFSSNQLATLVFNQFEKRHYYVKKFGKTSQKAKC